MTYVGYINRLIRDRLGMMSGIVSFGQNISTGSCLSGLTRDLPAGDGRLVINTPNSENTLMGIGFGLLLEGAHGIFFMKQQDFLLLGLDHLVNTWNALRTRPLTGSFTIVSIIVDSGYEGPQSCLNNLPDLCSIARVPGYTIANKADADLAIGRHFVTPGVRLIGLSQRLFRAEMLVGKKPQNIVDEGDGVTRYGDGNDITVVSTNFAFPQAEDVAAGLSARKLAVSHFNVAAAMPSGWEPIVEHATISGRLVLCDDAKSMNRPSERLVSAVRERRPDCKVIHNRRTPTDSWSWPNADALAVDVTATLAALSL